MTLLRHHKDLNSKKCEDGNGVINCLKFRDDIIDDPSMFLVIFHKYFHNLVVIKYFFVSIPLRISRT